jgi:hypothetical protein
MANMWMDNYPNAPVTFDEGHVSIKKGENPLDFSFERFFKYPYNLISLLTLLASVLFVLFGLKRFWPEVEEKEEIEFGKERLVINTARLLERGKLQKDVFIKYIFMTIQSMGKTLHAPPFVLGNKEELLKFLDQRLPKNNRIKKLSGFYNEAELMANKNTNLSQMLNYAGLFHRWKEEIEIGSRTSRQNH